MGTYVKYTVSAVAHDYTRYAYIKIHIPGTSVVDIQLNDGVEVLTRMESLVDKPLVYIDVFSDALTVEKYSDHVQFTIRDRASGCVASVGLDISDYTRLIRAAYSLHANADYDDYLDWNTTQPDPSCIKI